MKKIVILSFLFVLILCSFNSCGEKNVTRITDINLFINEDYANEEKFSEKYQKYYVENAGKHAKEFFPEYEDIEYQYDDIEFYMSLSSYGFPNAVMVLELKFDNSEAYQNAKQDIYSKYDFLDGRLERNGLVRMPTNEFYIGNYYCRAIDSEEFFYPSHFGIICTNEENSTIRYLHCYNDHLSDLTRIEWLINGVEDNSGCDW